MSAEPFNATFNRSTPSSPPAGLPMVTFTDAVTFHWNGDEIRVHHVPPAHTDGDSVVHFGQGFMEGDTFTGLAYDSLP